MAYHSFKQMESILAKRPGVTNPAGLAATIANRTYGKAAVQHAAATGTSLRGHKKLHTSKKRHDMLSKFAARHGR